MSVNAYLLRDSAVAFKRIGLELILQITVTAENVSTSESKELTWSLCNQLRESLGELDVDQRQLECVLSFDNVTGKPILSLKGTWINHLVDEIGLSMKLQVTINKCYITTVNGLGNYVKEELFTTGMVPRYSCNNWVLLYEGSLYNAPESWRSSNTAAVNGKLTIKISGVLDLDKAPRLKKPLDMSATSVKTGQSRDLVLFSNSIFSEQFETDVEIISSDGSRHSCHQIFLTGN